MCYVTFVRSPYAHAIIKSIDASAATDLEGVVAVITGEDVKDVGGVPCAATDFPNVQVPYHPVLATGKVRFVGEPVAAIVATKRYTAHDAVDLVEVDLGDFHGASRIIDSSISEETPEPAPDHPPAAG